MRQLVLMVGLVVVAIACATGADMMGEILDSGVPDAGAQGCLSDCARMQYVGNSTQALGYDQALYTHYAACQETFGPGTRTCTGAEITFTTEIPQLAEGFAWYEPRGTCTDCGGGSTSSCGNAVNEVGTLSRQRCSVSLPIARCGPK
jgi:hypothetical protein